MPALIGKLDGPQVVANLVGSGIDGTRSRPRDEKVFAVPSSGINRPAGCKVLTLEGRK